jgi:hypothetical protein
MPDQTAGFFGSACKNLQFYRPQQYRSIMVRPKEPMTPKVKEDKAFANWFRDWIALIQQNRVSVEPILPKKKARADGQEHSDGTHLFGPKLRDASCRNVA